MTPHDRNRRIEPNRPTALRTHLCGVLRTGRRRHHRAPVRLGGPPARARRAPGLRRPARPHRHHPVRDRPRHRRAQRVGRRRHRHRPAPPRGHRQPRHRHRRGGDRRLHRRGAQRGRAAALLRRRPRRVRRAGAPALPLRRPAPAAHAAQPAAAGPGQRGPPGRHGPPGLRRDRDAAAVGADPEGSREFSVPARLHHGSFYALPQSPQLAKQLLMVGGFDRYFQIARCLRDEDLRADRQFEFMQLDMECSFASQDDVMGFVSEAVLDAAEAATGERPPPIERMTWAEALDRFGTDKPDLRFGMELVDLTEVFERTEVKAFSSPTVKAIVVPDGAAFPRKRLDELTEQAKRAGAAGLAWFRVVESGGAGPAGPRRAAGAPPVGGGSGARPGTDEGGTGRPHPGRLGHLRHGLRGAGHAARGDRGATGGAGPAPIRLGRRLPHVRGRRRRRPSAGGAPPVHHAVPRGPAAAGDATRWPCVRRPTTSCSTDGSSARGASVSTTGGRRSRCSPRSASAPRRPRPASGSCSARSATAPRRTPASPSASTAWWRSWPARRTSARSSPTRRPSPGPTSLTGAPTPLPAATLAELGIRVVVPPAASPPALAPPRPRPRAGVSLFADAADRRLQRQAPLAARLRPRTLDEVVGQEHLVGPGRPAAHAGRGRPGRLGHPVGPRRHRQDHPRPPAGRHHRQAPHHALGHRRRREGRARGPGRGAAPPGRAGPGDHALHRRGAPLLQVPAGRAAPRRRGRARRAHRGHHGEPLLRGQSAPVEPGLTVAAAPLVAGQPAHPDPARAGARGGRRRGGRHRRGGGRLRGRRPRGADDGGGGGGAGPRRGGGTAGRMAAPGSS